MAENIAEFNNNERKWVRKDAKECCICESTYSTSPELFEVEFEDGEKLIYCVICLDEGPFSEVPEEIKIIKRVK